jgi:hypothetical protein
MYEDVKMRQQSREAQTYRPHKTATKVYLLLDWDKTGCIKK